MLHHLSALTFGLSRRLTWAFGLLIVGASGAAIMTNISLQLHQIEARLDERAATLGELVADVSSSYLFDNRIAELDVIYEDIKRQRDIAWIDMISPAGMMLVSGEVAEGSSFLELVEDPMVELARQTGVLQRLRGDGVEHVAVPVLLGDDYLGTVRFGIKLDEHDRQLAMVWRFNLFVGSLFVILGVLLSALVARRLTSSLARLTAMAERAARGDFDHSIELRTNDEVEHLATSFNTMLGTIRDSLGKVHAMAYRDELTALPNRAWFQDQLERTIADYEQFERPAALLFLDLDQFKKLNDTLGHHAGDALLVEVAQRLRVCLGQSDQLASKLAELHHAATQGSVSRLGGDEFTILLPAIEGREAVAEVARTVLEALSRPFDLRGQAYCASVSVGVALLPDDGTTSEALLKCADAAMYQAKGAGRGTFRLFDAGAANASLQRASLERDLRQAIVAQQFEVYFQPQFSAISGEVIGAEALVRWRHPEAGLLLPASFLPLAEEAGLMPAIGRCVITAALALAREWARVHDRPLRLAVNISVEDLAASDFAAWTTEELRRSGFDPAQLEFEITEGAAMFDSHQVEAQIRLLREAGIRFAVDDFGVGYSNIARLKHLAFETLKIDRSLLGGVGEGHEAEVLFGSILSMANALGLDVVAEGVETHAQLAFLRRHECTQVQGYLLGRPMPGDAFRDWIETLDGRKVAVGQD